MTLSDRSRQRLLDDAVDTLARIAIALGSVDDGLTVMDRIRQAEPGPTAQRYDAPHVGGHITVTDEDGYPMAAVSDPTGEGAVRAVGAAGRSGRIPAHRAELDRLVGSVANAARRIERIVAAYGPPRAPNEADRRFVAQANGAGEPGCESCARTDVASGVARWVPIDSRLRGPTDVGGRLDRPMALCVWCHDKVESWGRIPTTAEVAAHHEGRRVNWPDDVARPA